MIEVENEKELIGNLKSGLRVFALFYASWCPFCRAFLPIFKQHAQRNVEDKFLLVKVDDETNPLWEKYEIDVVPTVILFKSKKVSRRLDGTLGVGLNERQLEQFLGNA